MFSGSVVSNSGAVFRFGDLEKAGEYPSPEYDGLLSETYLNRTACALENAKPYNSEDAAVLAAKALGCDKQELQYEGESNGRVNCHMFRHNADEAYISCDGGLLVTLQRSIATTDAQQDNGDAITTARMQEPQRDADQALKLATSALADLGYSDMVPIETVQSSNGMNATFIYEENGVRCYPDEIRISYSPQYGITSLNANGYITNHRIRNVMAGETNGKQTTDELPVGITMELMGYAVIEDGYGGESVCREYHGQIEDGKTLRLFCDVETGTQSKIEIEE